MTTKRDKILILGAGNAGCGMVADSKTARRGPPFSGLRTVMTESSRRSRDRAAFHPVFMEDLDHGSNRAWLAIVTVPATGQDDSIPMIAELADNKGVHGSKVILMFNSGRLVGPIAAKRLENAGFKNILETCKSPYSSHVENSTM